MSKSKESKLPQIIEVELSKLKLNSNNPRIIKDHAFEKLVKSIKEFPEMLQLRPIIVNKDMVILGGNMRARAAIAAGHKTGPVIIAENLEEARHAEFVIKDNVPAGEWDWDLLANDWDSEELVEWGLEMPKFDMADPDLFVTEDKKEDPVDNGPKSSDDDYSTFELVMLHENKLALLDTLNKVKREFLFERQEEALMEILRKYNS